MWQQKTGNELIKEDLEYTIMIRQPDFITKEMVRSALERAKKKKPTPLLDEILFDTNQDGFEQIMECHRELYLNNAKRVPQSKLQTILRYRVK